MLRASPVSNGRLFDNKGIQFCSGWDQARRQTRRRLIGIATTIRAAVDAQVTARSIVITCNYSPKQYTLKQFSVSQFGTRIPRLSNSKTEDSMSDNTQRIRALNDTFRTSLSGGTIVWTNGVHALSPTTKSNILTAVRAFARFTEDNDPHGEHDFASITVDNVKIFWKIDYYNRDQTAGSEDPADPEQTSRVMTIMLASEY